jgi:hypothetical protein
LVVASAARHGDSLMTRGRELLLTVATLPATLLASMMLGSVGASPQTPADGATLGKK